MGNCNRLEDRINLYDLVMEIAEELTDTHPTSWQKDRRDNDLRRDLALAMNTHGVDSAAILPHIKRALENGEITALSTFNGLPSQDADEVISASGVWRSGVSVDELPVPDSSVLREWFLTEGDAEKVKRLCGVLPSRSEPRESREAIQPIQRSQAQEQEILAVIRAKGYDPTSLPVPTGGRAGIKAEVRKAVGNVGMWSGRTVFDKAWERLRATGEIADEK